MKKGVAEIGKNRKSQISDDFRGFSETELHIRCEKSERQSHPFPESTGSY